MNIKNEPCFINILGKDSNLYKAVKKASLDIGIILLTQKNARQDLDNIYYKTIQTLRKYDLYIELDHFYDGKTGFIEAKIGHTLSNENYIHSYPFSLTQYGKVKLENIKNNLGVKACIDLLGLDVRHEENNTIPLDLKSRETISISFSDIEMYYKCPRCFYLAKKNIKMPFQEDDRFNIANANDLVLKQEFDLCRNDAIKHPIMKKYKIDAVPLKNTNIYKWRNFNYGNGGIRFFDLDKNIIFNGVVDDVWVNKQGEFIVVDYKTTLKESIFLEDELYAKYRRQISFYTWLFKQNGYLVHSLGYLIIDKPCLNNKNNSKELDDLFNFEISKYKRFLEFDTTIISISIDESWIDPVLDAMQDCLKQNYLPPSGKNKRTNKECATCEYHFKVNAFEKRALI